MTIKGSKKGPCLNCESRFVGCHSSCVQYLDWRQKKDIENKEIWERKASDRIQGSYSRESYTRYLRRKRNDQ